MKITTALYRAARISANLNAASKGPSAVAKRQVRRGAYKTTARTLRRMGL